ncbi:hypothetical protein ACWD6I_06555 [Streptomyces sp. NPDC002454]
MGSLRNPVGPLPSSIYWRRRAVLLSLAAVALVLLIIWLVSSSGGGGGGTGDNANGSSDKNPVEAITPGPSGSGPAISEKPGGRDEPGSGTSPGGSGGPGSTDAASTTGGGSGDGSDGSGGSDGANGADGEGANGSGGAGGSGGADSGQRVPAGSDLPDCTASAVRLSLSSAENTYGPGKNPELRLTAKNTSDVACKIDLGPKAAVVTITQSEGDEDVWVSDHCPKGSGSALLKVPANGSATHTLEWNRKRSAADCGTPRAGSAAADTYLVEAELSGFAVTPTSFVLRRD